MIQSFEIPGRLDGKNEYQRACRTSYRVGARMKRENQDRVIWAIKKARLKPMSKVNVSIHWIEPNMRRDKQNVRCGDLFIFDALVEMGIIQNDGWKHIGDLHDSFSVNKANPRIIVTLEEV